MERERIDRFGAAVAAAESAIDWPALGALYCEGDARDFFDAARVSEMRDTALLFASDLADLLASRAARASSGEPSARAPHRSLYLGAAAAELALVLFERIVLERRVAWVNLPGPEAEAIDAALAAAEEAAGTRLPRVQTTPWRREEIGPCDHLWLCSVLTDPERFPALHDALYERRGTPDAIGRGNLRAEREAADELGARALSCLVAGAVVSTTDEELAVLHPLARRLGARFDVPDRGRITSPVGDTVRHCRWQVAR